MQQYIENMKYGSFACYWKPAGKWRKAHGNNKAGTGGVFYTETMQTSGDKTTYRVRVMQGGSIVLGPFEMLQESQPNDDDVVKELKNRA